MAKRVHIVTTTFTLNARVYGPFDEAQPRSVLIFFCGWNPGNFSWTFSDIYASLCSKRFNYICLTVGFRGMGSPGEIAFLTRSDFLNDVLAVYDFIVSHEGVNKERISVVGESFGSYMACLLSAKRPIKNLILRVPSDFPNEGFSETPQIKFTANLSREWKLQKHTPHYSFALDAIHHFKNNVFLIASENDSLVPPQTIENYLAAASNSEKVEFHLMKNTGHALINPIRLYEFITILYKIISKNDF